MANYITEETQAALIKYKELEATKEQLRGINRVLTYKQVQELNRVTQQIWDAFRMLTNGLVATNRFFVHSDDVENLKMSCIMHLFSKIQNYDTSKNAFSYFNMVARNFFICEQNKNRRRSAIIKQATAHALPQSERQNIFGHFEEPRRTIPVEADNRLPAYLTGETQICSQLSFVEEQERVQNIFDLRTIIIEYRTELGKRVVPTTSSSGRNKNVLKCKIEILDNMIKLLNEADDAAIERRIDAINALSTMSSINFTREIVTTAIRNVRKELIIRAKNIGAAVP